jgi:signal transduction histidine kinase
VAFSLQEARVVTAARKRAALAGLSLFGAVTLWLVLAGWLGVARASQLLATLVLPAIVMIGYWLVVRERIQLVESDMEAAVALEVVTNRATAEFLAGVSSDLRPHPELCSLRAEALAVAVAYRELSPELKVAVPDVVTVTDPHILRQVLHLLVGNAIRHGGSRIAIWAAGDGGVTRLSVSDDGPGLSSAIEGHVFERHVDLAGHRAQADGSGLPLARSLAELIGGEITYRRDATWTHFSIQLPADSGHRRMEDARVELEAGVR